MHPWYLQEFVNEFLYVILIFGERGPRAEGHKKRPPRAPKMIFFAQIYFFSRVHTLDSCFLQKNALILVKYSLQSPV